MSPVGAWNLRGLALWSSLQCCCSVAAMLQDSGWPGGLASSELSFRRYRQLRLLFIGLQGASQKHVGLARPKYLRKGFNRSFKRTPRCGLWDWLGLLGTGSDSSGFCGEPWWVFSGILSPSRFGPQVLPAVLLQLGCNFAGLLGLGQRPVPSLVSNVWPCQFK